LRSERRYVEAFLAAVIAGRRSRRRVARRQVVGAMRAIVQSDRLLFLMELSIEPVLATQVGWGL
jgi:hypothetical protein